MRKILNDADWSASRVQGLPDRWKRRLLGRWEKVRREKTDVAGNVWLRETTDKLGSHAVPLNASDADICEKAEELAKHCFSLASVFHGAGELRAAMGRVALSCGIEPPSGETIKNHGAIARMTDALWWRRGLRTVHAITVERAAIEMGYVNRASECYASDESVVRVQQQARRNQKTLERTTMENEEGQRYTLAELAAKGVANKAIRRGELMVRIAGFEEIARECGHVGLFLTVTCPSRMHKYSMARNGSGAVFQNAKYDGTNPREANRYLGALFQLIRAKLGRKKWGVYGFRIAEPNHDATPHWHLLLFMDAAIKDDVVAVFKDYALRDSPDERGAQEHRVTPIDIDWSKGSAAGYVAKYVAKNIDGMHVEKDLLGNDAMHTAVRVEAWAKTWKIRQFQQIGGAPVGVWRELRRVKKEALPDNAPAYLVAAHDAVNRIEITPAQTEGEALQKAVVKAASWAEYVKAQGGATIGRKAKIGLMKEQTGEIGKYGEVMAAKPVGVVTCASILEAIGGLGCVASRVVEFAVKSVRHTWRAVRSAVLSAAKSAPWTGVNNCTPEKSALGAAGEFLGEWMPKNWSGGQFEAGFA